MYINIGFAIATKWIENDDENGSEYSISASNEFNFFDTYSWIFANWQFNCHNIVAVKAKKPEIYQSIWCYMWEQPFETAWLLQYSFFSALIHDCTFMWMIGNAIKMN